MSRECPNKACLTKGMSVKRGFFRRKSDSKFIQRYQCKACGTHYSSATFSENYGQNKRRLNPHVLKLYVSGNSQRRIARLLNTNLKTVARKVVFLNAWALKQNTGDLLNMKDIQEVQFDELETSIHTKLKPASVVVVVNKKSRHILALNVKAMPAKGLIAKKSRAKYGRIKDERPEAMHEVFKYLQDNLGKKIKIESDENPRYPFYVKTYLPEADYVRYKGRRGCVVGQGELKAGGYDPLFSLNHTCAMLRANINRLFRRTWCTSKRLDCLQQHLNLYMYYHNHVLIPKI